MSSWNDVLDHPEMKIKLGPERAALLGQLNSHFNNAPSNPAYPRPLPASKQSYLTRLLHCCPCLCNQADVHFSARAVVHLCEVTLGTRITDQNVHQAFQIQHPKSLSWKYPPVRSFAGTGGTVMELLCSEVLGSAGISAMKLGKDKWPVWSMPGHVLLNEGKMNDLKALGDILIPCAPTNLVISVKSEKAKERLLYSANSIEGIGFGFFDTPSEFWTKRRMQLYKRMGFSAIYMPDTTLAQLQATLKLNGTSQFAVNINGTALYRPLTQFSDDMKRIVGKSAFDL